MASIWLEDVTLPQFPSWNGDKKTDVLIVGGGMVGLLCAYFLQEAGVDYTLVEGRRICGGVTSGTTAKITAQHGLCYQKLLKHAGYEQAKMYLDINCHAVQRYREIGSAFDCDFEEKTSYIYTTDHPKKLEQEERALLQLGYHPTRTDAKELPIPTAGAIGFLHQAQFHPLKFAAQIAKGLHIYENTFVREWKDHTAVCEQGTIAFRKAIFASHFPIVNTHGMYFLKMYQSRSYVAALADGKKLDGMYMDENKNGFSFRNYKNDLLVGGGAHRTGKCRGKWEHLLEFVQTHYLKPHIRSVWAAQDCMTLDGIPYIGLYAKHMPDCYVATGFHKWGMTSSMVSAMILTDLVMEKQNPYALVFSPSRSMIKPQLLVNGWEAAVHLLIPAKKRCPHLGCGLKWNRVEESWDCPCHGSRFDKNGKLLNNPANGNLKSKQRRKDPV